MEHKEIEERPTWCSCNESTRHLIWLVDWAGLSADKRTWEPAEALTAVALFKAYNKDRAIHWRSLAQAKCERKADRWARVALGDL